jgi:hypothetical protein
MEKIRKYIDKNDFIQWIFEPNEQLEKYWETYLHEHPEEKQSLMLAKRILQKFKTDNKSFSDKEKLLAFSKLISQIGQKENTTKFTGFPLGFLKYAAVAIVFFAVGAAVFYQRDSFQSAFYSGKFSEPISNNEVKLIRSDGEKILLTEEKSVIKFAGGQLLVNNQLLESAKKQKNENNVMGQLIVPYGKSSEIILADGTKVYLNAGSRFVYPEEFQDKNREVFLSGEAFFEVAHDKEHPFIVQTTDIRVKVLGTRFNVSAYPTDDVIETVLTEGKVKLGQNGTVFFPETMELNPNQLAVFYKSTKETRLMTVDADNYTLWKDGVFKFESIDLGRVVKKLERYFNIQFQYSDPLIGSIKISGKLQLDESREEVIDRIAVASSVNILKKGESAYVITR